MLQADCNLSTAQACGQSAKVTQRRIPALGLSLVDATQTDTINALLSGQARVAYFINAHCCNVMAQNRAYAQAVHAADLLLPDGVGVSMAAKMTGQALTANLNGTDLIPLLAKQAAVQGKSIYLLGGRPGTARAAAHTLKKIAPGLRIAGVRNGYSEAADTEALIAEINKCQPDIVLVAMGVPMQELWISRFAGRLDAGLCLGVGAAFDFLAGNIMRAPEAVRRAKLEWVWRLSMEPRRMFHRYVFGNVAFLARSTLRALRATERKQLIHRASDIVISGTALVLLSPLLLGTAIAVRLDSKGPALFRQTRVGRDGKHFPMYKFRSMHIDAEARQAALLKESDRDGVCFKSRNDPRVTRLGRFIRQASIDELPQIFNVLRGDMSIVGPRPALPREVALYPPRAYFRLSVKPGITGIWQVAGRADISFERMVEMDLTYARSRTLLLDLILIMLTLRAVISGRGAY